MTTTMETTSTRTSVSAMDNAVIITNNASQLTAAAVHTYKKRKYSNSNSNNGSCNHGHQRQHSRMLLLSFPWKLHSLLERYEYEQRRQQQQQQPQQQQQQQPPIFGWTPDGKGFAIYDQKRFVNENMPSYFFFGNGNSNGNGNNGTTTTTTHQSRIESFQTFQRNLESWGFTTKTTKTKTTTTTVIMDGDDELELEEGNNSNNNSNSNVVVYYSHPLFIRGFPAVCMNMQFGSKAAT